MNQCDGCRAGKPVVRGMHRMGEPGRYPDYMTCERVKYEDGDNLNDWEFDDAGNLVYIGGEPPDGNE